MIVIANELDAVKEWEFGWKKNINEGEKDHLHVTFECCHFIFFR